jgi:hypothetical protein
VVKTKGDRVCPVCGTLLADNSDSCPVCALRGAVNPQTGSVSDTSSELRFEHYWVLTNEDGTPIELGHGAMGVTYKAVDVNLQCTVALKVINARLIGDDSARLRFLEEGRLESVKIIDLGPGQRRSCGARHYLGFRQLYRNALLRQSRTVYRTRNRYSLRSVFVGDNAMGDANG